MPHQPEDNAMNDKPDETGRPLSFAEQCIAREVSYEDRKQRERDAARAVLRRELDGIGWVAMLRASSSRPLPSLNVTRSGASTDRNPRGTASPRRMGLPRRWTCRSTGASRSRTPWT